MALIWGARLVRATVITKLPRSWSFSNYAFESVAMQTMPPMATIGSDQSGLTSLRSRPPYAPELNPVENVWEYLRGNKLAITVFESYDDIVDKSCAAWRFFADDPERVASVTSRTWATVNP